MVFLLEPVSFDRLEKAAWPSGYPDRPLRWDRFSCPRAHVVVAGDEAEARSIAADPARSSPEPWWLDEVLTSCKRIDDGPAGIILTDQAGS